MLEKSANFELGKYDSGNSIVTHTPYFHLVGYAGVRAKLLKILPDDEIDLHLDKYPLIVVPLEGDVRLATKDRQSHLKQSKEGIIIPITTEHCFTSRNGGLIGIVEILKDEPSSNPGGKCFEKGAWIYEPSRSNSEISSSIVVPIDPNGAYLDCTQVDIWHSDEEPFHWHQADVFGFIYNGKGEIAMKDGLRKIERHELKTGDNVKIPHGLWHVQNTQPENHIHSFNIEISSQPTDFQTNRYYSPSFDKS